MTPNDWPLAQRAFHEAYLQGQRTTPRTRVHWRILPGGTVPQHTNPFIGAFHGVAWALRRIVTRKTLRASNRLAVWPLGAPKGAEPSLVFEIDENPGPPEGDGAAVGDFVINGTLCIVADDGRTFWPTYNPEPSRRGVALR